MSETGKVPSSNPAASTNFELYKLYLATAERVSDRRAAANTWLLSINSAIVALYGLLYEADIAATFGAAALWTLAIPAAGVLVCLAWMSMLTSFAELNEAKFTVLHQMEAGMPFGPFTREEQVYEGLERKPLSKIEKRIPFAFMVLHGLLLSAAFFVAVG